MDSQSIFNAAGVAISGLLLFIANGMRYDISHISGKVDNITDKYAKKEEVAAVEARLVSSMNEVKAEIKDVAKKLENLNDTIIKAMTSGELPERRKGNKE